MTSKIYPTIFDYNYVLIQVKINNKIHYLDATNKFLPFGQIPLKTINGAARVLDFKEDSYWVKLKPKKASSIVTSVKLKLNNENDLEGRFMTRRTGYFAEEQRRMLSSLNENDYLEDFENTHPNIEVDTHKANNINELNKPLSQVYTIKFLPDESSSNSNIRINPILFNRIKNNPFKLKKRNYPVDFGYAIKQNYSINIQIPEGYEVNQLPKDLKIAFPNKGGSFIYTTALQGKNINAYARLVIAKRIFSDEEYFALKEFYKQIIIAEETMIVLKKK